MRTSTSRKPTDRKGVASLVPGGGVWRTSFCSRSPSTECVPSLLAEGWIQGRGAEESEEVVPSSFKRSRIEDLQEFVITINELFEQSCLAPRKLGCHEEIHVPDELVLFANSIPTGRWHSHDSGGGLAVESLQGKVESSGLEMDGERGNSFHCGEE